MSYAGRRPLNSPRYGRAVDDKADDRATPQSFVDAVARELGLRFTVDVAAARHNAKCLRFYDRRANGLKISWRGETVWCNCPYSNISPWVAKAWFEAGGGATIVMLLPANRTEQGWWQTFVEKYESALRQRARHLRAGTAIAREGSVTVVEIVRYRGPKTAPQVRVRCRCGRSYVTSGWPKAIGVRARCIRCKRWRFKS